MAATTTTTIATFAAATIDDEIAGAHTNFSELSGLRRPCCLGWMHVCSARMCWATDALAATHSNATCIKLNILCSRVQHCYSVYSIYSITMIRHAVLLTDKSN